MLRTIDPMGREQLNSDQGEIHMSGIRPLMSVDSGHEENKPKSRLPVVEPANHASKIQTQKTTPASPSFAKPKTGNPNSAEPKILVKREVVDWGLELPETPRSAFSDSDLKQDSDCGVDKIDFFPKPTRDRVSESIPVINLGDPIQPSIAQEEPSWEERLERANSDRRVLARFFAICLCCVAFVNMVPALYHWYHWTQLTESMQLPRWIYIQVFVGAIHLVYAVFLFQINDWSAMRAVSVAMLAVAFVFGFISTGLLIGGGDGNLTGFLGIPYTLNRQASIWCVAMLCLATLMSYWGGKESTNWQRAEYLLKDILARSPV